MDEVDEDESDGVVEGAVEGEEESDELEVEDVIKDGLHLDAAIEVDIDVVSRGCEEE